MKTTLGEVKVNDVVLHEDRRLVVKEITDTDLPILCATDLDTLENYTIFGSKTLEVTVE